MTIYQEAPDVEALGREIIRDYHSHLVNTRITFCFVSDVDEEGESHPIVKKGKEWWGSAKRVSGLNAHLAGEANPFFVMEISEFAWGRMEPHQRRALVDHELCHMILDEDKLVIAPHDIEEFAVIVARHGIWSPDVKTFADVVSDQLKLGLEMPPRTNVGAAIPNKTAKAAKPKADDTTVTVSYGERSVTVTGDQFKRAARNAGKVANGKSGRTDKQVTQVFEDALEDRGLIPKRKGRRRANSQPEAA